MKKLLVVLVLLFLGIAIAAYYFTRPSPFPREDQYTFAWVEFGTLTESVSATGVMQPQDLTIVGSDVPGIVTYIYPDADFNREVEQGAKLVELDKRFAENKKDQAEVAVKLAKADEERAKAAVKAADQALKYAKSLDYEQGKIQAEANYNLAVTAEKTAGVKVEEAETARRLAQLGLDLTTIRAPVKGIIIDRKVVVGQPVGPTSAAQLFTIAAGLKKMQVHAMVSEGDIGKIKVGQEATFTVNAYAEENDRFVGKVVQIRALPITVQSAVFYNTVIEVANKENPATNEWMLRPGMPAAVDITLRQHKSIWKVPTTALSFQLEPAYQTDAAKAKLNVWHSRSDHADWKPMWILGADKKPWPIFVRIGGARAGEFGIKDNQYNEILEWELGTEPDSSKPESFPRVILSAPPAKLPGFFDQPISLGP